jgi:S1-C subfamily serine protease
MFQQACLMYEEVLCSFGGGTHEVKGKLHGAACLVSPRHVVTAAHNVQKAKTEYDWPVVSKFDGLFKCEVMAINETADVAILRATEKLADATIRKVPTRYPAIKNPTIGMGMTVGYMTWLQKKASRRSLFWYFSTASVSYLGECPDGNQRWVLSGGFVEPGFSGSPVFLPDGSLIGMLVGATTMSQQIGIEGIDIYRSDPHMSPIPLLTPKQTQEINQAAAV